MLTAHAPGLSAAILSCNPYCEVAKAAHGRPNHESWLHVSCPPPSRALTYSLSFEQSLNSIQQKRHTSGDHFPRSQNASTHRRSHHSSFCFSLSRSSTFFQKHPSPSEQAAASFITSLPARGHQEPDDSGRRTRRRRRPPCLPHHRRHGLACLDSDSRGLDEWGVGELRRTGVGGGGGGGEG